MDDFAFWGLIVGVATFGFIVVTYFWDRHRRKSHRFSISKLRWAKGKEREFSIGIELSNLSDNVIKINEVKAHLYAADGRMIQLAPIEPSMFRVHGLDLVKGERDKEVHFDFHRTREKDQGVLCDRFHFEVISRHSTSDFYDDDIQD